MGVSTKLQFHINDGLDLELYRCAYIRTINLKMNRSRAQTGDA